jgi:hypothetical protein
MSLEKPTDVALKVQRWTRHTFPRTCRVFVHSLCCCCCCCCLDRSAYQSGTLASIPAYLHRHWFIPSLMALQVAVALAMGRAPEAGADAAASFQRDLVGQGGAGYAWVPPEGQDIAHFSIAPPPM